MKQNATDHIEAVLDEVMTLMREAFAAVDYHPEPGSALDQLSLLDGDEVVQDYIEHGEVGLAFDHLLYMVEEPPLPVSQSALEHIRAAAAALRVHHRVWTSSARADEESDRYLARSPRGPVGGMSAHWR